MLHSHTSIFINVFLAYINWFAVAILAGIGKPLFALLPSLGVVGIHLLMTSSENRVPQVALLLKAALIGFLSETLFIYIGTVSYPENGSWGYIPPLFMVGLWVAFATTLQTSLFWLHSRLLLSAAFGFLVSGPSYYAGEKLGALLLARPLLTSLLEIGTVWCFAFPFLLFLARRD